MLEIRDVKPSGHVEHPTPRPMAEDHEERVLQRQAELPEPQRGVCGRAEVVHDHDVGRIGLQCARDSVGTREVLRNDGDVIRRDRANADAGAFVQRVPLGVDVFRTVHHAEEDLDGVTHARERDCEERRCGAHAADG